jgi:hypothetical protein
MPPRWILCLTGPPAHALRIAAILIAGAGSAYAITSDSFDYSTPQTGLFSIAPTDLVPDSAAGMNDYTISADGASLATGSPNCFNKGLNLPQGARLGRVEVWYRSIRFSTFPRVMLVAARLSDGIVTVLTDTNLPDNTGARISQVVEIGGGHRVDNFGNGYGFSFCLLGGDLFYGARITYRYRDAGD